MLTLEGQGNGQDSMRRAAMGLMGEMGGGPSASAPEASPQSNVGQLLAQATQMTFQSPSREEFQANMSAWIQAWGFMKKTFEGMQQSQGTSPPPQPGQVGMNLAQASPATGRPPR